VAPQPSPPPTPERPGSTPERPRSRGRAREDELRAALTPLAPGERPGALVAATVLAGALGLANLIAYLAGAKLGGKAPGPEVLAFSAVMAAAAVGMWRVRYWAVLGFQVLLAVSVIFFGLLLAIAANLEAVAVSVAVIGLDGWLFWKLVRVLGRMQAPPR
jgi:hypothetical protein